MKFFAYVVFAVVISSSSASAVVEQCRFIQSKSDREACYDRQAKTLAAKRKAAVVDQTRTRSLEEMKIEHDQVNRSLRSICRGC